MPCEKTPTAVSIPVRGQDRSAVGGWILTAPGDSHPLLRAGMISARVQNGPRCQTHGEVVRGKR